MLMWIDGITSKYMVSNKFTRESTGDAPIEGKVVKDRLKKVLPYINDNLMRARHGDEFYLQPRLKIERGKPRI